MTTSSRVVKDPDVCDPIRYLREREIVHFQRFGEALRDLQDHLDSKNFYAFNPSFDKVKTNKCKKFRLPSAHKSYDYADNNIKSI